MAKTEKFLISQPYRGRDMVKISCRDKFLMYLEEIEHYLLNSSTPNMIDNDKIKKSLDEIRRYRFMLLRNHS